ncbi:MAG: hypothetical protein NUW02_03575 [Candidatus Campbellbacteria bacterium]|nr:hypothetical protein [Candidatus Campbellbacteria bacterium]
MKKLTISSVIVMILFGGLVGGATWYSYDTLLGSDSALIGESTYVAVFLTTNQVFFGKIESMNYRDVILVDAFYLQQGGTAERPEFILQKSGNELHAPEDTMFINREHILIIQPLRESSQVIASINQYKESLKKATTNQPAPVAQVEPVTEEVVAEEPQVLE